MFDIGWSELLVIGIVALVVIGPKELPGVLRSVGFWIGKARRMAGEFQSQFQEAMREAEVADLKKEFDELASGNVLTSTVKDVEEAMKLAMATGANVAESVGIGDFGHVDEYSKRVAVRKLDRK